jgi:O-methyltransferase involved in polyketide biosynthesis
MTQAAVKTGSGPTVVVAIEQHFPKDQRIIEDVLAYRILPLGMKAYVWLMRLSAARNWMIRLADKRFPGIWAG